MTLIINSSKLTATELRNAISKLLNYMKNRNDKTVINNETFETIPHGKQTVKDLIGQDAGVSNVEISDKRIRSFDRVARKYGVDYAVKKVKSPEGTKFYVFFKSRDADAISAALTEFTSKKIRSGKKSVVQQLHEKSEPVQETAKAQTRTKHRELER